RTPGHLQSEAAERRIWEGLGVQRLATRAPTPCPPGVPRDRMRAVESAFLKTLRDPEFVAEAEKTRMTLNPIPGTTLHSMIVEGLHAPALEEKLKPIFAPKG
ncbi:MAG: hypothetical protein WBW99_22210, partial [Pseudolabrys sp.]